MANKTIAMTKVRQILGYHNQGIQLIVTFSFQLLPNEFLDNKLADIIEDRHGKRSTIFASQLPVRQWYEIIGEKTVADAILDRIVHDAHRVELMGESLRKIRSRSAKESELE